MKPYRIARYIFLISLLLALAFMCSCEEAECKHRNTTLEVISPTHTDSGYTQYTCTDCSYTYKDQFIEPIEHNYQTVVTAPTCTKEGSTLYTCECGSSYTSDIVSPTGHSYSKNVAEPTCLTGGSTKYTCDICADSYVSDLTDAKGHSIKSTVIAPTCTAGGYTLNECECGYSYQDSLLPPLGHSLVEVITAPTCTAEGFTTYTCYCGYTYNDKYTSPTPHTFSSVETAANCTDQGYTTHTCSCGYSFSDNFTVPTGHHFTSEVLSSANCTESGEVKFSCACGESYSLLSAPTGHQYSKAVTMPTLSDMGQTVFTCVRCTHAYTGDFTFFSDIVSNAYADDSTALARGIDISYHNYQRDADGGYVSLDWEGIKNAGITYVIIRIGDAAIGIDPTFEKSYNEAKAAGLDVGFYFYTRAMSVHEIALEANLVLSALKDKQFEYPVYLDLEDESQKEIDPSVLNEMCIEFFTTLQRSGYYTALYVNDEWLYNVIDTETALSRFDIWYARYPILSESDEAIWQEDKYGAPFGMWQYTDSGAIEGIDHTLFDFNICYKDYPSIIKEYGFNGYESDFKFIDSGKSFVWVTYTGLIKIRSKPDYFTTEDYDASLDVIGYASYGSRYELVEQNEQYTAIKYNGVIAYISANPAYISFNGLYN